MEIKYATLNDVVYFQDSTTNPQTGGGADASPATFQVRKNGAAAGAAAILTGNATLLTSTDYGDGAYEIAVTVSVANGFEAGVGYSVWFLATVGGVTGTKCIGEIEVGIEITAIPAAGDSWLKKLKYFLDYSLAAKDELAGSSVAKTSTGATLSTVTISDDGTTGTFTRHA